jgi:hypothetical protein
MSKAVVWAAMVIVFWGSSAEAGGNAWAYGAVHLLPHGARTCEESYPVIEGCEDIITTEPGPSVDAFPVFFNLTECQGVDYALSWIGSESCVFYSCSDHVVGDIVWPGDGVLQTWDTCRSGPVVIPGWVWIEIVDAHFIYPVPRTHGAVLVYDCHGGTDGVCCPYMSGVAGLVGDDPCAPVGPSTSRPQTWGGVKSLFR